MKTTMTKKFFAFILLMFSAAWVNAQNCGSNKVYACLVDACDITECKCVPTSQLQNCLATTPPCAGSYPWEHHHFFFRIDEKEATVGSLQAYPNPVSNSTTISVYLEQTQN